MKTTITASDVEKAHRELEPNHRNICSCCVLYQALKRMGFATGETKVWSGSISLTGELHDEIKLCGNAESITTDGISHWPHLVGTEIEIPEL